MPGPVGHRGDEVDGKPVSIELEDFKGEPPDTIGHGDRYLVGYVIVSDIHDEPVFAVDDITSKYRNELKKARRRWAQFSAWIGRKGGRIDPPRIYITPSEM